MTRTGGFTIIALVVALAQAPAASSAGTATADLANLVNAARAQHGLGALHRSSVLDRSALLKTQEILRCRSFSHTPCGTSFVRTFQQAGYARARARFGENLYW